MNDVKLKPTYLKLTIKEKRKRNFREKQGKSKQNKAKVWSAGERGWPRRDQFYYAFDW